MATTAPVLDGVYALDKPHSTVQFAVRHVGVSTFRASFADLDGRLVIDNGIAVLEAGAAVESVSIDDPDFRAHIVRGSDFFAADTHPRISFRSTRIDFAEDGTLAVDGVLEIRGVKRPVSAVGTFAPPTEDPFGAVRVGLALEGVVDRRSWGLDWQQALPGGGDAVGWDVEISAHLELAKSA